MEIWQADTGGKVYGGNADAKITLYDKSTDLPVSNDDVKYQIIATNPSTQDVLNALCYLNQPFAGAGFTTNFLPAVAYQESGLNGRFRQFIRYDPVSDTCNSRTTSTCLPATGVPVQSFDNGYGIMQITKGIPGGLTGGACQSPLSQPTLYIPTTNTPTQNMIWNWVANINAGAAVMLDKYKEEIAYENKVFNDLNRNNLGYLWVSPTTEQRQMNVWQRYNGCLTKGRGCYYVWSLCATKVNEVCRAGWVKNPALPTRKCPALNPSYFYADCVNYWAHNNPQWCK